MILTIRLIFLNLKDREIKFLEISIERLNSKYNKNAKT